VTRLGEFLPIGLLFTLGSFLKITEVVLIFGLFFGRRKLGIYFDQKMDNIFGDFSQTHLVTQPA
jgi:hypothetical protein